jgi:hypothetical protein
MKRTSNLLLLAGSCLALAGLVARACAPVMEKGGHVTIASESAVILYDEKTKTEEFIRRASFQTQVPYFGFLVPTPTQPAIDETPDEVFQTLEDWTKPEVVTQTVTRPRGAKVAFATRDSAPAAGAAVEVLDVQFVAGGKATVLKANDAQALKEWLQKHGYVTRPDLEKWLAPYIKQGWYITAFQIIKAEKENQGLSTKAMRMTFKTDRPFYPYAEPDDQRRAGGGFVPRRLLRIFLISSSRMEGKLDHPATRYPGQAAWANRLSDERRAAVVAKIGGKEKAILPASAWLTVFDDRSSPRPGVADLYFSPSPDQSTIARPPIIHYNYVEPDERSEMLMAAALAAGGLVVLLGVVLLVWRLLLRRLPA